MKVYNITKDYKSYKSAALATALPYSLMFLAVLLGFAVAPINLFIVFYLILLVLASIWAKKIMASLKKHPAFSLAVYLIMFLSLSFKPKILAVLAIFIILTILYSRQLYKRIFLKNAKELGLLEKISKTDCLTKISNRRAFDEFFQSSWQKAAKDIKPLTVFVIDIDHFKLYNDHYGHIAGDNCLVRIAAAIDSCFKRHGDMFARYGGEEFVGLVQNTINDDIDKFAEQIRLSVEGLEIPAAPNAPWSFVTISIGVAKCIPDLNLTPNTLIELADTALYQAKSAGRNKVMKYFKDVY